MMEHYIHDGDGRRCLRGPDDIWRHFEHPKPEPGPKEHIDYRCDREHFTMNIRKGPLPPLDGETDGDDVYDWADRGDFGMPGIGIGRVFMIVPDHQPRRPGLPDYTMTVQPQSVEFDFNQQGFNVDLETPEARMAMELLPTVLEHFLNSNIKYSRAQTGHDLGLKGIVPDINRKTSVLISRLWYDEPEAGREPTDEIIGDLIGHLLLMLAKMRMEDGGGQAEDTR